MTGRFVLSASFLVLMMFCCLPFGQTASGFPPDTDGQNKVPIPAPIPVPAPIQRRLHQGPFDDDRPIAAPVPLKPDGGVVQPSPTPDPTSDLCTDLAKAGANLPSYCK